ncbi:Cupin-like domain-containing protein [Novosphingobium kunmingense]|uniref:Cupin-like domain-containing protein n=1 Tax=Novosphingobium kunmingense TaxID=1211806 RepID=A0A2N0H6F8_9SPHN|nr:cupin-like domain-containing protein [Novosphingobium kunmingense]PKB14506.1 Cupin-like domain-containing protein [Novosphingobium kunmingense]
MAEAAFAPADLPAVGEEALAPGALDARLRAADRPFIVRGLAADWPLVQAARAGADAACAYLVERARDRAFPVTIGTPGGGDRLFYDDLVTGMNFRSAQGPLAGILDGILANADKPDAPAIYLSSIDTEAYFQGLRQDNALPLGDRTPIESIWIGNRTRIAAHNDVPDNLAVCAAGRRRFTLFPPEQLGNLYIGPLENTPAGRAISMVDLRDPDFAKFPRFRAALDCAMVADLEPGDALFVPSLWWHHVEAFAPFNVLVNYWWRDAPAFLGKPEDALLHAILAVRDLPAADRERWRALFDHYVFDNGADVTRHLPDHARGILAPLTPDSAGQIRARLLRSLSR